MFNKILVVCIGNICRSPMVEAYLKTHIVPKYNSISVQSAGIAALVGRPADTNTQEILQEHGMDCSMHQAQQLTSKMILDADLILVMEHHHRREIEKMVPSSCGKVHLIGKWGDFEIPDPYRKSKEFFKYTYELIVQGTTQWQEKLWK